MTATDEHKSLQELVANPEFERRAQRRESWRGFFHAIPANGYLILFFVLPLVI